MCGIFGLIANGGVPLNFKLAKSTIDKLITLSEIRGKEASGVALKRMPDGDIFVVKGPLMGRELMRLAQYEDVIGEKLRRCFTDGENAKVAHTFAVIGHTRLVTNGSERVHTNNHPVIKDGVVVVHNGVVTNVDDVWAKNDRLEREAEVDTESLAALFRQALTSTRQSGAAIRDMMAEIAGAASVAMMGNDFDQVVLATNTGSLYAAQSRSHPVTVFASERHIVKAALEYTELGKQLDFGDVEWCRPGTGRIVQLDTPAIAPINIKLGRLGDGVTLIHNVKSSIKDLSPTAGSVRAAWTKPAPDIAKIRAEEQMLRFDVDWIRSLKRCTRCVRPETMPFIRFDGHGVCNYCKNHVPRARGGREEDLRKLLEPHKSKDGSQDCVMAFSGGRDSSYGLHFLVREMGMTPVTFTYDWGMATDIARRNIARVCGKLGLENIMVSADLRMKRANLRKNIIAWLKKPNLGLLPLFMAGDKQFVKHANRIKRETGLKVDLWCANWLENTDFKVGFCGIPPALSKTHIEALSGSQKTKLASYYMRQFARNPAYINSSLVDTAAAFASYYLEPRSNYIVPFDYTAWDEDLVNTTIRREFDWETATDSKSTWRIGDAPIPFINYCYLLGAGFSEIDTFRSNQVREGMITREKAMELVMEENRPRYDSISKFLDVLDLDYTTIIREVNKLRPDVAVNARIS